MHLRMKLLFVALTLSTVTFAQTVGPDDAFQVRYASNLTVGDSVVDLTNTGTSATAGAFGQISGSICVNVYTFDPAEELISCCACSITPNGLQSLSVRNDLIRNTLTPAVPTSVVIKLVATAGGACNASSPTAGSLASGLRAWGTTIHALPTAQVPGPAAAQISFGITETAFSNGGLSAAELAHLTTFCGFIQANGSGFGICSSCRTGALGAGSHL
jgi:hypothetical protein